MVLGGWLIQAAWRQQPGALIAALVAVALGIALATGVHLVNRSALAAFASALATVNGEADLQVSARLGMLDDTLLEPLAAMPGVAVASPVIDARLQVASAASEPIVMRAIGLDPFRAAGLNPALVASLSPLTEDAPRAAPILLAPDSLFLAPAALRALDRAVGERITILGPDGPVSLRIAGTVGGQGADERLAVMDIAAAQWHLGAVGRLSRLDLRLATGADATEVARRIEARWPGLLVATPDAAEARMSNLSRAYRVNLNVLALVALLTGAFIVQAAMALAVARLASTFALLGLLGAPAAFGGRVLHALALAVGALGALAGLALGIGLAWVLLRSVGADLGGGYFQPGRVPLHLEPAALAGFAGLGILAASAGAWGPARRLGSVEPMRTLRGGLIDPRPSTKRRLAWVAALGVLAVAGLLLPPFGGLALGAYASMACLLLAGIGLIGPLLGALARRLEDNLASAWRRPAAWLAIARLADQPGAAAVALSGVVASFALVTAMSVMVYSFRQSVDTWLTTVLPADLYVRARASGELGALDADARARLTAVQGVADVRFLRTRELTLARDEPPLTLIAREIDPRRPEASLPLTGSALPASQWPEGCLPAWASEPARIRLGWSPGDRIELPVAGGGCAVIAGIWRDYARQHGALAIALDDYRRLSGDDTVSDAAITLAPGAAAADVAQAARAALEEYGAGLEIRSAGEIRAISLAIFDRSFALTYVLESIALLVGLFGVFTTYAGEAQSRQREFGLLRHLGFTRRQLATQFASESCLAVGTGVGLGAVLGGVLAQVLIHWVNPQSFHWRMDTTWPLGSLAASAAILIAVGVGAAILATRRATGPGPIAAVRADW